MCGYVGKMNMHEEMLSWVKLVVEARNPREMEEVPLILKRITNINLKGVPFIIFTRIWEGDVWWRP